MFLHQLKKGEKAVIKDFDLQNIPLKLIELGCLPENEVELLQIAPLGCPYYFLIDNSRIAIRQEITKQIKIQKK